MVGTLLFRRVLLKLSGDLLKGNQPFGLDPEAVRGVATELEELHRSSVELAVVVGAGNFIRGASLSASGMSRPQADRMGMLATVINALALQDALEHAAVPTKVLTPTPIAQVGEPFDHRTAKQYLAEGNVVIFAGGTGHPFLTTDTTAALRACEIQASVILKATKVDGIYSADPEKDPSATRYDRISHEAALAERLKVMDSTAFSLCMDNGIPILVFRYADAGILPRLLRGDFSAATYVGHE